MKATPKSCSCTQCTYAKHSKAGHKIKRKEERAFRHGNKQALRRGVEVIDPAPHGTRIG